MRELPPPETLFLELPAGIRSLLLLQMAQAIEEGAVPFKHRALLDSLYGEDRLEFIITAFRIGREMGQPYRIAANDIDGKLQRGISAGMALEKAGDIEGAIDVYENLLHDGPIGSTPCERLRILYTKRKEYGNAVRACMRYIQILSVLEQVEPGYPNVQLIPHYQEWIVKLSKKAVDTDDGK